MSKIVFEGKTPEDISYVIRYPQESDLSKLWIFINEVSKEKTFVSLQGEEISLEDEKKWLDKQLGNIKNNTTVYLLVEAEHKIIGVADINMIQIPIGTHVGRFGIIIGKKYRHQGIGKNLIEKVLEESKRTLPKLKIIILGVFGNNLIAKKLYEEYGFKEYGRLPKGILYKGEFIDDIKMYKEVK